MIWTLNPADPLALCPCGDPLVAFVADLVTGLLMAPQTVDTKLMMQLIQYIGHSPAPQRQPRTEGAELALQIRERLVDEFEMCRVEIRRTKNIRLVHVQANARTALCRLGERQVVGHPQVALVPHDLNALAG